MDADNQNAMEGEAFGEQGVNSGRSQGSDTVVVSSSDVDSARSQRFDPDPNTYRPLTSSQPVCYCVYEEVAQGTFYMQWRSNTQEPITNHIMMFIPTKPVPKFKLINDGGRSELATKVMPDKQKFWSSLCLFIKQAKDYKATLQVFPGWNDRLPYKSDLYTHNGVNIVTKIEYEPITLDDVAAIGVAGRANILMANRMSKDQFSQGIRKGGYCLLV